MASKRTARGRFEKGHSGNPAGRPARKTFNLDLLCDLLTPEREEMIYKVAIAAAMKGNKDARAFLWAYKYGKPVERREITAEVIEPWLIEDADEEDQTDEGPESLLGEPRQD